MLKMWPNGLGFDRGTSEAWMVDGGWKVYTPCRSMFVPYHLSRATPASADSASDAIAICEKWGAQHSKLADMSYDDAQWCFWHVWEIASPYLTIS